MTDFEKLFNKNLKTITTEEQDYTHYFFKRDNKKRVMFDLVKSFKTLEKMMPELPKDNECFKLLSPAGGWSSCSLVMWFAKITKIKTLKISTLRVGKKELNQLLKLGIDEIFFIIGDIMRHNTTGYDYDDYFENECKRHNIKYCYVRNHSKIILMDTMDGKFIVETSSNFNENPQIEQFNIEKGDEVFQWYDYLFNELLKDSR